jgi:hypothetical protein
VLSFPEAALTSRTVPRLARAGSTRIGATRNCKSSAADCPRWMLPVMPAAAPSAIVLSMEKIPTQEFDSGFDLAADTSSDEDELVRAWREEQLIGLGLPAVIARVFADHVDWHDIASLVGRGCPPMLALEIVR